MSHTPTREGSSPGYVRICQAHRVCELVCAELVCANVCELVCANVHVCVCE